MFELFQLKTRPIWSNLDHYWTLVDTFTTQSRSMFFIHSTRMRPKATRSSLVAPFDSRSGLRMGQDLLDGGLFAVQEALAGREVAHPFQND